VNVTGGYTHSDFIGEAVPGSDANGRVDKSPSATLNVTYQVLHRLQLLAFVNYQSRSSNVELYNFSDTTMGISAKLSYR
jgi:hypothetical protein